MATWPFIGRDEVLEQAAAHLRSDDATALVLAGRAGVGKTRLARELVALEAGRGVVAAWARGSRAAASIPFGALEPALAGPIDGAPMDRLRETRRRLLAQSGGGSGLFVVDDAHLLDDGSASLLEQLALAGDCKVIVTVRTGEPVPDPVLNLWKEDGGARIDLQPLSRTEVGRLVGTVLGGDVDPAAEHRLWDASRGNVLFLRELVIGGLASGALVREALGRWWLRGPLPTAPRLIELVEARLVGLDDDAREILDLLAVADEMSLGWLLSLRGPAAVEALEDAGLIERTPDQGHGGRRQPVRLAHPVYGEAIRGRMSAARGQEVRSLLVEQVSAFGRRRSTDVLQVATWALDGGVPLAWPWLLSAAQLADNLSDPALADRLAGAARQAGAGVFAVIIQGVAAIERADWATAHEHFSTARELATSEEEIFRTAHGDAYALFRLSRIDEAVDLLKDAIGRLTMEVAASGLRAELAMLQLARNRPGDALETLEPVLSQPAMDGWFRAADMGAHAAAETGAVERALELSELGAAAAREHVAHGLSADVFLSARAAALLAMGRLDEAAAAVEEGHEASVVLDAGSTRAAFVLLRGDLAFARGALREAAEHYAEAAVLTDELHEVMELARGTAAGALVRAMLGDVPAAAGLLAAAEGGVDDPDEIQPILRARAWLAVAGGEHSRAVGLLEQGVAQALGDRRLLAAATQLHDLARIGEARSVHLQLRTLSIELGPANAVVAAMAEHADALVTDDPLLLEAAAQHFHRLGLLLLAGEAASAGAAAFRAAGKGRRAAACDLLVAGAAATCDGVRTPAFVIHDPVAPLSTREREVATLAARGLTSRAIAEQLFLSTRTVENHLQRAYAKLGIVGRGELAAALERSAGATG